MAIENSTGRTRWKVFALALVAGLVGMGIMFGGLSTGVLAASFSVSGMPYKASADKLVGNGVVQFGSVDQGAGQTHPVLVNGFQNATANNFCQSFIVPSLPVIGDITIKIEAPGSPGMSANNLVIGLQDLTGDLTLNNVQIGRDAGTLDKGPNGLQGPSGAFGIQADSAEVDNLRQLAWSTTATTLRLNSVNIHALAGHNECY